MKPIDRVLVVPDINGEAGVVALRFRRGAQWTGWDLSGKAAAIAVNAVGDYDTWVRVLADYLRDNPE